MTKKHSNPAPAAAQSVQKEKPLPDRETIERRAHDVSEIIYRAKSIASAAEEALCTAHGPGSDVHGCLKVVQELLGEAQDALDSVVLLAPAEAQEVAS